MLKIKVRNSFYSSDTIHYPALCCNQQILPRAIQSRAMIEMSEDNVMLITPRIYNNQ